MKKKLLLFALVAASTTLNGCSCSAETYYSSKQTVHSSSSSSVVLSTSNVTSTSKQSTYSYNTLLGNALSTYLEIIREERVLYELPELSTNVYYDYDSYIRNALSAVVHYEIVDTFATTITYGKLIFKLSQGSTNSGVDINFYDNNYMTAESRSLGGYTQVSTFKLTNEEAGAFMSAVQRKYSLVNDLIIEEENALMEAFSAEYFFNKIDNLDSGRVDVYYDTNYWQINDLPVTEKYNYDNLPSYYPYLKDLGYTVIEKEKVFESTPDRDIFHMGASSMYLYLIAVPGREIEAQLTILVKSTYISSGHYVTGKLTIDQTKFIAFSDAVRSAFN